MIELKRAPQPTRGDDQRYWIGDAKPEARLVNVNRRRGDCCGCCGTPSSLHCCGLCGVCGVVGGKGTPAYAFVFVVFFFLFLADVWAGIVLATQWARVDGLV